MATSEPAVALDRVGGRGTGSAQITYRVAANDTGATRTGHITVGTAVFTVQQAAAGSRRPACTFDVSPKASDHG